MKPSYEVWLEIVKERMLEGDSAVIAVSKAQIVTTAYNERFSGGLKDPELSPDETIDHLHKLKQKYEEPNPLVGSYTGGDPNAR